MQAYYMSCELYRCLKCVIINKFTLRQVAITLIKNKADIRTAAAY